MPPASPTTPPTRETRTASTISWRRISRRFEPSAMRSAISLPDRQSAPQTGSPDSRTPPAGSAPPAASVPAMKARAGPPSASPTSPGRASVNLIPSSSCGYVFPSHAPITFRSAVACSGVTPGFSRPTTMEEWLPRSSRLLYPSICGCSAMGTKKPGAKNNSVPRNCGGATPKTVYGCLLICSTPPHHAAVVMELRVPEGVTQHDEGRAVHAALIGAMKEASKVRMNPQCVEVIPAHLVRPRCDGVAARFQPRRSHDVVRNQALEAVVPVAQIAIIGDRLRWKPKPLHHVQVFRVRHVQRMHHDGVQHTEHHRVCANPQC